MNQPNSSIAGANEKHTIVFIHGAGLNYLMWHPQIAAFKEDFHLLTPDLPGHGRLAHEKFSIETAVQHLHQCITDEVCSPVLLVGVSLGGYIAMEYAHIHANQVAGLVLSGSSLNLNGLTGFAFRFNGPLIRMMGVKRVEEKSRKSYQKLVKPEIIDPVLEGGLFIKAAADSFGQLAGRDYHKQLQQFSRPILVLNGENDDALRKGEDNLLKANPTTRIHIIPNSGHLCNMEAPSAFNDAVRTFAKQLSW